MKSDRNSNPEQMIFRPVETRGEAVPDAMHDDGGGGGTTVRLDSNTSSSQVASHSPMRLRISSWKLGVIILVVALGGCAGMLDSIMGKAPDQIGDKIEAAIEALNKNSSEWQATLNQLSEDMRTLETQTANDIDLIAQRGIAATGAEFRCNADFLGHRVKEELQALLAKVRGQAPPPRRPSICHVVFSPSREVKETKAVLDMETVPKELLYYGYNLRSVNEITAVLKHDGGEIPLQNLLNWPTDYLMTLTTAPSAGAPMCNLNNRRIVIKSGGEELSSIGVIPLECPEPPPPKPQTTQVVVSRTDKAYGKFIGGFGEDRTYGGACSAGFTRKSFRVLQQSSKGAANCSGGEWVDDNPANCAVQVHYSIAHSAPDLVVNSVTCEITVLEESIPEPPPPPPPCPCW
jgi:hypothetical protein